MRYRAQVATATGRTFGSGRRIDTVRLDPARMVPALIDSLTALRADRPAVSILNLSDACGRNESGEFGKRCRLAQCRRIRVWPTVPVVAPTMAPLQSAALPIVPADHGRARHVA